MLNLSITSTAIPFVSYFSLQKAKITHQYISIYHTHRTSFRFFNQLVLLSDSTVTRLPINDIVCAHHWRSTFFSLPKCCTKNKAIVVLRVAIVYFFSQLYAYCTFFPASFHLDITVFLLAWLMYNNVNRWRLYLLKVDLLKKECSCGGFPCGTLEGANLQTDEQKRGFLLIKLSHFWQNRWS